MAIGSHFKIDTLDQISWGIIGCGDVTEVKSGPAFNKVPHSRLTAVMRRDADKAKEYALRHGVPVWYSNASELINDPAVNAIYIATPPSSHEAYTMAAIAAGKPVYVEKPMTTSAAVAKRMAEAAVLHNSKLCVAHYRREQPLYKTIRQLVKDKVIGEIRFVRSDIYKKLLTKDDLAIEKVAWRVDPSIAGGGLFHDLSPHQLDLMCYFLGEPEKVIGLASNQGGAYAAADIVTGHVLFKNGALFSGIWCFNIITAEEKDNCIIVGDKGTIQFSFFEHKPVTVTVAGKTDTLAFNPLPHVQQPMIDSVVRYFRGEGPNPCSAEEGTMVMQLIDGLTAHE